MATEEDIKTMMNDPAVNIPKILHKHFMQAWKEKFDKNNPEFGKQNTSEFIKKMFQVLLCCS